MARMTKESLEAKIKKAEERVVRTGETYNAACEDLNLSFQLFKRLPIPPLLYYNVGRDLHPT